MYTEHDAKNASAPVTKGTSVQPKKIVEQMTLHKHGIEEIREGFRGIGNRALKMKSVETW